MSWLRFSKVARRLHGCNGGVSTIEFAMTLPLFVALGMYGTEVVYMASVNMQISQIATAVADNAARLGQTDNSSVAPSVTASDIDSVMNGAVEQGSQIRFSENGRVILTSLERDSASSKQYIHWQRCAGELDRNSAYGNETDDNGLTGDALPGMGRSVNVTAKANQSVMFVEVYYQYDGLFSGMFTDGMTFREEASFITRDDRSLTNGVSGGFGSSQC